MSTKSLAVFLTALVLTLTSPRKATACCGIIPQITQAAIGQVCFGQTITISGNINGLPQDPNPGAFVSLTLSVTLIAPSLIPTTVPATVSPTANPLQYTYTASFTPTELGTYTEAKTAVWTNTFGAFSGTLGGTITVVNCCPGKVTLGGWKNSPSGARNNFGGNVTCDGSVQGEFEFQFQAMAANVHVSNPAALGVVGNTFAFSGPATVNGSGTWCLFVKGADNSEPGAGSDVLELRLYGGATCTGTPVGQVGPGTIDGGNIAVH